MSAVATSVYDALPGLEVPVNGIGAAFEKLWADSPVAELRATQLNLVLHLGSNTSCADAREQFQVTVRFSQRYPCRVVVLCPDFVPDAPPEIRAKIYGECSIGKAHNDTRCCEFVILHYTMAARAHLENQVSTCLSTDLPIYYWAHRFAWVRRMADYGYLLTRSARVLFDSAVVPPEAFGYPWPKLSAVRDLAYTRTLPLRQNLGQFLSRYHPASITSGLEEVVICHHETHAAEAACLLGWVRKGLARGGAKLDAIKFTVSDRRCAGTFAMEFRYGDPAKHFSWTADLTGNKACFTGDLGSGRTTLQLGAHLLAPEATLSEAMFF